MSDTNRDPRADLVVGLIVAVAALAIALVQPRLFATVTQVKDTSDVYPLPPPEQLPVLSLGYRAAMADALWATVLVTQGLRLQQHRRFEYSTRYMETIFELDPTYRRPYLLLDTITTFGAKPATPQDVYETRRLFEKGMRERPTDGQLFLVAGSFMTYLATSVLSDEEQGPWRLAGAGVMARALELGTDSQTQWHALAAAGTLTKRGQREAAVGFLERAYNLTDDPELRGEILRQLQGLKAQEAIERAKALTQRFDTAWRDELPFVSRSQMLLLGPRVDPSTCAGPGRSGQPECRRDWLDPSQLSP